jgi:uncharacterized protein with GYD domain
MVQHYIILARFTDQGIRNIKDTTRRADAAKSEAEKIGGKFTIYWTFGNMMESASWRLLTTMQQWSLD